MQYEWEAAKAASNLRDHGIDFLDAIAVLEDPNRLEDIDTRIRLWRGANPGHRGSQWPGSVRRYDDAW